MRRRPGTLLPLEADILAVGLELQRAGEPSVHGFRLAKALAEGRRARTLTAHGTLYKALGRMTEAGLLTAAWEDPHVAAAAGRPRRRCYEVTGAGERALAAWEQSRTRATSCARPSAEPT